MNTIVCERCEQIAHITDKQFDRCKRIHHVYCTECLENYEYAMEPTRAKKKAFREKFKVTHGISYDGHRWRVFKQEVYAMRAERKTQ